MYVKKCKKYRLNAIKFRSFYGNRYKEISSSPKVVKKIRDHTNFLSLVTQNLIRLRWPLYGELFLENQLKLEVVSRRRRKEGHEKFKTFINKMRFQFFLSTSIRVRVEFGRYWKFRVWCHTKSPQQKTLKIVRN